VKNFLVALSIVVAGISVPGNSASATEVCLAKFQDSDWRDGQPNGVVLNSDLILSKSSVSFVNLNGDYFKINFRPEDFRYIKFRIKAGLSQTYFLNSNSKLSFMWVYEGKSCLPRVIEIEANAVEPTQEFSVAALELWANNLRASDTFFPLNFKEIELAKEIFLKAREYVYNNPRVIVKYRDFEAVKNLTFDDYRGNERFEFPQRIINDDIQSLITSEYKSENPTYLKNLKHAFLQLQAYSPDGCIRFHINDIIRQQKGLEGKSSLYSPQGFGFYYFPKKQDCKFNLVYFNQDYDQVIPLGQIILRPVVEQSNATIGKKTTITCIKGKVTKKFTAIKPKCPTGYRKK
jgi:hypothetical protein